MLFYGRKTGVCKGKQAIINAMRANAEKVKIIGRAAGKVSFAVGLAKTALWWWGEMNIENKSTTTPRTHTTSVPGNDFIIVLNLSE